MKRILIATTGSLGDLHPLLAIGLGLRERGWAVVIATSENYRQKILQAGSEFAPMGPHFASLGPELMRQVMDARRGPEYLIRKILYPEIPSAYREAMAALRGCDAIVTHPITFAAQIAAEKSGLPWISTVTAPLSIPSRYDPPVYPMGPGFARLRNWGPAVNGLLIGLGRAVVNPWRKPVTQFRLSLGLPKGADPLFEGQHSPRCVLAMFSRVMAQPQIDWPAHTHTIGFPFYDQAEHGQRLDPALDRFLDGGEPPVVFTLGSSAVLDPGPFYQESVAAVKRLGCRAVLLTGANAIGEALPAGTIACAYAPYSQILPRAACIVHQGGIGTCGQALAAGRPMLVMPFAFDQPDNGARLERLGVARVIARKRYDAVRAAAELDRLLSDRGFAEKAEAVGRAVRAEDAVGAACDAIQAAIGN